MKILIFLLLISQISFGQAEGFNVQGGVISYDDGEGPTTQLASVPVASQGSGGTVTQTGNKGTAVTINKRYGRITTTNAALAAAAEISFTVNNSTVAAEDVILVCIQSGGTAGSYFINVGSVSAGAFTITLGNVSTGSLSQAIVINFVVIKSVIN